jgi:hypothetical protein
LGMHEMFSELSLGNYVTITHQLLNSRLWMVHQKGHVSNGDESDLEVLA